MKSLSLLAALALAGPVLAQKYEINEMPMYGGEHNPDVPPNKEASREVAALGWKYFYRGDFSTAMKRFNQAWMLDRENADAFWGFGVVMGRRAAGEETGKNLRESIKCLAKARELNPGNGRIAGDLAFSYTILGHFLQTEKRDGSGEFRQAEELFREAYEREPTYPPVPANWAVLKFYTGQLEEAKRLVAEARRLGYTPDPEFLKDLDGKAR